MADRRIYVITERDIAKAASKRAMREQDLAEIESHRDDRLYWKRRRTTFGLAKRDASKLLLAGDEDFYAGRGQGMVDAMTDQPYSTERLSAAYNAGYHDGYRFSPSEMRDYIRTNANFAGLPGGPDELEVAA